jgi:LuxR family transcriptional regulator, maltose regulon positive regulatory protein
VTVLVAGAGFGKSSILAQAIDENRLAPRGEDCWLGLDSADADTRALAEGLATALGTDLRQVRGPGDLDVRELAATLADEVWRRAPREISLVLDDIHEVPVGSDAADLLAGLVDAMPTNAHVTLAGRTEPPLPLARLRSQGRVGWIGEDELVFDDEELTTFAALRDVPADRVADLGGWPALAELQTAASGNAIDDFLTEEVLRDLPDTHRTAVATVAVLGGADQELLDEVLDDPVDIRDALGRMPLAACDPSGWCGIHPLWSERLGSWLPPGRRVEAQRRAGVALATRDPLAALRLLRSAGADDELRKVLRIACRAHNVPTSAEGLARVHRDLPPPVQSAPEGDLLAGVATAATDLDKAVHLLRLAADRFAAAGELTGLLPAVEHLAICSHWREDLGALGELWELAGALRPLPEAQVLLTIGSALLADTAGDAPAVLEALDDLDPQDVPAYWRAPLAWLRASALLALGYPQAALGHVEAAVAEAPQSLQGVLSMLEVNTLVHCGEHADAAAAMERMIDRLAGSGNAHTLTLGLTLAANRCGLEGRLDDAERYLADAHRSAGPEPSPPLLASLTGAEAMIALARGDEARAAEKLADQLGGRRALSGRQRYGVLRRLPVFYVLVPRTRTEFEQAQLGPCYRPGLALARALVASREQRDLGPAAVLGPEQWREARAVLPAAWRAELTAAALAGSGGRAGGLADELGPSARPTLRALTDRTEGPRALRTWARTLHDSLPTVPAAPLEVGLLGPTTLRRDGRPVEHPHWRRERVRALLLVLLARGGGTREELAGVLWPDLDAEAGARNLRVTLSYLLAVLEPERAEGAPSCFVRAEGTSLRLVGREWLEVDAWEMERALDAAAEAEARGEPSAALDLYRRAVALFRGPYLTEAGYEEWALPHRDRLNARFVSGAVRAGELTLAGGDPGEALQLAARALEIEPWSEAAHRLGVAAHLAQGDRAAARRAMDTCLRQIEDLGVEPTEDTQILLRTLGR